MGEFYNNVEGDCQSRLSSPFPSPSSEKSAKYGNAIVVRRARRPSMPLTADGRRSEEEKPEKEGAKGGGMKEGKKGNKF